MWTKHTGSEECQGIEDVVTEFDEFEGCGTAWDVSCAEECLQKESSLAKLECKNWFPVKQLKVDTVCCDQAL